MTFFRYMYYFENRKERHQIGSELQIGPQSFPTGIELSWRASWYGSTSTYSCLVWTDRATLPRWVPCQSLVCGVSICLTMRFLPTLVQYVLQSVYSCYLGAPDPWSTVWQVAGLIVLSYIDYLSWFLGFLISEDNLLAHTASSRLSSSPILNFADPAYNCSSNCSKLPVVCNCSKRTSIVQNKLRVSNSRDKYSRVSNC